MTMIMTPLFAQNKMSEEDIIAYAARIENDWRFGFSDVMWLENEQIFERYFETAPLRCPEELQTVLDMSGRAYQENLQILRLEKQVYRKPGAKKWEASLAKYFNNTDKAKEKFASARKYVEMYERMAKAFPSIIDGMRNRTYDVPKGDLVNFEFHSGGGMIRRPPIHLELARQKDGSYIALFDTEDFDRYDTLAVSKAKVDEIRQLLIDGEVYKMPRYYDTPVMLLDAPHSHVSVEFTDGSYSCSDYPPEEWGGKNIGAVCKLLRDLQTQ